jgi:hypothetical protein
VSGHKLEEHVVKILAPSLLIHTHTHTHTHTQGRGMKEGDKIDRKEDAVIDLLTPTNEKTYL